jgi:phosphatidylcholine synthase
MLFNSTLSSTMSATGSNIFLAWLVHLYTASGAIAAFFGTLAVFNARYREAFLWMAFATVVDSTDGPLARLARVNERLPEFDGARLDDIVDYLTFAFLPMLLLHHSGALPDGWGSAVAAAVLLSSAFGFSASDAKSDDHYFTGFPSYWNIVALYLHVIGLAPVVNAMILLGLSTLVFVRTGYVYPSRTPAWRTLTIGLGILWGGMVVAIIVMLPAVPRSLVIGSLFFPVYYFVLSFSLHLSRRRTASRP